MIVSAIQILAYLNQAAVYEICDAEKVVLFSADHQRITELATAGQICGFVRGTRLRWIELIVPLSEAVKPHSGKERSASGAIAQDCRTIMRGHDLLALDYVHNQRICQTYGSTVRQKAHQAAATESRLARAKARNRPVVMTFTQRASLSDRLALSV